MKNNNFTVDGTVRSITVTKQVSVFNGKTLPTREASLTLVVNNDFNCVMSNSAFHIWLDRAPWSELYKSDQDMLKLINKPVQLQGYFEVTTGNEPDLTLEVSKLILLANPSN
ncbi:hypothetical protein J8137_06795 [Lactiplantibacillus plantarum]|nr:hypothetical protein [Lactiplantibacillus plantarum]